MSSLLRIPALGSLAVVLAACGGARTASVALLSPGVVEEPVSAVLLAAFQSDNRLETIDSLWDTDAPVVANGQLRHEPPRFAGLGVGGEVAISSSRLEVRQSVVWVFLDYRWLSLKDGTAGEGKATILLTPRRSGTGWMIVHAHSSTGS